MSINYERHTRKPKFYNDIEKAMQNWQLYSMILFPLLYILIFKYQPMYGAQIAFRNFNPIDGIVRSPWVGLDHFSRFVKSPIFITLMKNTLLLNLYGLIAGFPFPILLALSLNYVDNKHFKRLAQTVTYIPNFISTVVIVGILMQLLNPTLGIVNHFMKMLGLETIDFFGSPQYFRGLYVWSGVWQSAGWGSIVYLSALAGIDRQLHEAAIVDGANKLRRIWHIDLPGIMPTTVILLILSFGGFLNTGFEKVYLMQSPLNLRTSEVIDTYVYKMGLGSQGGNFSYSSAVGLFKSVISFIMIIAVNQISKKLSETSLW